MIGVKSDSDSGVDIPDALGVLAEEFIQQYRLGMKPDIDDYCRQHPECASRIRDLFPMLLLVEDCGVSVNSIHLTPVTQPAPRLRSKLKPAYPKASETLRSSARSVVVVWLSSTKPSSNRCDDALH